MTKIVYTYLATDGLRRYKIGKSNNPEQRIRTMRTANPSIKLVCYGEGVTEKYLHGVYALNKIKGEWFTISDALVNTIKGLINGDSPDVREQALRKRKTMFVTECEKYTIPFGKYKGRKLTSMTAPEEKGYVKWYYKEVYTKTPVKKRTFKDKAFAWWYGRTTK